MRQKECDEVMWAAFHVTLLQRTWLCQSIQSPLLLPVPNRALFVCVDGIVKSVHQPDQTFSESAWFVHCRPRGKIPRVLGALMGA